MRLSLVTLLLAAVSPAVLAQDVTRGIQLFEAHDRAGARVELSAAVKQNDRDARAHHYLGRLAMLENDLDAAADHLERATKLDPTVSSYQFWYANAVGQQTARASKLKQPILARR